MNDDSFPRDVAKALADRRPAPARDFEARLLTAATRPGSPRRSLVPFALAAAVAVLAIVVVAFGLSRPHEEEIAERPPLPVSTAGAPGRTEPPRVDPPRPTVPTAGELLIYQSVLDGTDRLTLTAAQRSRLRDLRDDLATKRARLTAEREIAAIQLRRELDRALDATQATALQAKVDAAEAAIHRAELEARIAARALLTDDQRSKLAAVTVATVPKPLPRPVAPPAARATLKIETKPAGARVRIDGIDVGRSPLATEVAVGHHRIQISHDGYTTYDRDLEADRTDMRVVVDLTANQAATGILRVFAVLPGKAYVDGRLIGDTPIKITLAAGRHVVRLDDGKGLATTKTVTIEANKVTNISIDLED